MFFSSNAALSKYVNIKLFSALDQFTACFVLAMTRKDFLKNLGEAYSTNSK